MNRIVKGIWFAIGIIILFVLVGSAFCQGRLDGDEGVQWLGDLRLAGGVFTINRVGNTLLTLDPDELCTYQIQESEQPVLLQRFPFATRSFFWNLEVDSAWVTLKADKTLIVDLADPANIDTVFNQEFPDDLSYYYACFPLPDLNQYINGYWRRYQIQDEYSSVLMDSLDTRCDKLIARQGRYYYYLNHPSSIIRGFGLVKDDPLIGDTLLWHYQVPYGYGAELIDNYFFVFSGTRSPTTARVDSLYIRRHELRGENLAHLEHISLYQGGLEGNNVESCYRQEDSTLFIYSRGGTLLAFAGLLGDSLILCDSLELDQVSDAVPFDSRTSFRPNLQDSVLFLPAYGGIQRIDVSDRYNLQRLPMDEKPGYKLIAMHRDGERLLSMSRSGRTSTPNTYEVKLQLHGLSGGDWEREVEVTRSYRRNDYHWGYLDCIYLDPYICYTINDSIHVINTMMSEELIHSSPIQGRLVSGFLGQDNHYDIYTYEDEMIRAYRINQPTRTVYPIDSLQVGELYPYFYKNRMALLEDGTLKLYRLDQTDRFNEPIAQSGTDIIPGIVGGMTQHRIFIYSVSEPCKVFEYDLDTSSLQYLDTILLFQNSIFLNDSLMAQNTYDESSVYANIFSRVLDISTPSHPIERSRVRIPGEYISLNNSWLRSEGFLLGDTLYRKNYNTLSTYVLDPVVNDIAGPPEARPVTFELHPAYPNPFNAITRLTYTLPVAGNVQLSVFDILGRQVARLEDGFKMQGQHSILWDSDSPLTGSVASGVYFVQLKTAAGLQTRRVVLLK